MESTRSATDKSCVPDALDRRDRDTETLLLSNLNGINYVLLQRDWNASQHGDLDMVVDAADWPRLVQVIGVFCDRNDIRLVKTYEIEQAVICIVLVTSQGYVQVDITISPHRRELFGIDLVEALGSRELIADAYVLTSRLAEIYRINTRRYKASRVQLFVRRIMNTPVLMRRILETTMVRRGAIIYTPYLRDTSLLCSRSVSAWATGYLQRTLLRRYKIGD